MQRLFPEPQLITSIRQIKKKDKVWVEAYGCSASMADSEMIRGIIKASGYQLADNDRESSINLIVTCSVKDTTEHRMSHRIMNMTRSGKPLIVAGCLPKADRQLVESLSPSASLMGPNSIQDTANVLQSTLVGKRGVFLGDSNLPKLNLPRVRLNPIVSIIEVASGCLSNCTFCQTKLAKGTLKSYRIGDVVRQLKSDVSQGCQEIWLSSTDNGCYGSEYGSDIVELLDECIRVEGDFKIRIGMMNPMYLPRIMDRLCKLLIQTEKVFKFIHIPVESGSDKILRRMGRAYKASGFLDSAKQLREVIPSISIATDVIVGFPGETEDDFQQTLDLVSETQPDVLNISRYSPRRGTVSSKWLRSNSEVLKDRSRRLQMFADVIQKNRNSFWKGWEGEVIIDEVGSLVQGRNESYKPIVITNAAKELKLGQKVRVRISGFTRYCLKGSTI